MAAVLFDEVGYHSTTVEQIAQAVGLNKAVLYRYFESKEDILYSIYLRLTDMAIQQVATIASGNGSASEKLQQFMSSVLSNTRDHRAYVNVVCKEDCHLSRRRLAAIRRKRQVFSSHLENFIKEGVESGEFRDVNARIMLLAVSGICSRSYWWFDPEGALSVDELSKAFADIALRGIERTHDEARDRHDRLGLEGGAREQLCLDAV